MYPVVDVLNQRTRARREKLAAQCRSDSFDYSPALSQDAPPKTHIRDWLCSSLPLEVCTVAPKTPYIASYFETGL